MSTRRRRSIAPSVVVAAVPSPSQHSAKASPDTEYDAIVIGSGMGGLTTASQLAAAGQRVAVLER
jgi:prolycopene isomerase